MNYDVRELIFDNAYVQAGAFRGESLELEVRNVLAQEGAVSLDRVTLTVNGFSPVRVQSVSRKALGVNNTVKQIKGRQLYKSELTGFVSRLTGEDWDIVSADLSRPGTAEFTLCFGDGGLFSFIARCGDISAVSDCPAEKVAGYGKSSLFRDKFPRLMEKFSKKFPGNKH